METIRSHRLFFALIFTFIIASLLVGGVFAANAQVSLNCADGVDSALCESDDSTSTNSSVTTSAKQSYEDDSLSNLNTAIHQDVHSGALLPDLGDRKTSNLLNDDLQALQAADKARLSILAARTDQDRQLVVASQARKGKDQIVLKQVLSGIVPCADSTSPGLDNEYGYGGANLNYDKTVPECAEERLASLLQRGTLSAGEKAINRAGNSLLGDNFRLDAQLNWHKGHGINGEFDAVVPLQDLNDQALFLQLGAIKWPNLQEHRTDASLGLVYRRPYGEEIVLGASIFYDYNLDHSHKRVGLGLDVQSRNTYIALNTYLPLNNKWRDAERGYQEYVFSGVDAQLHVSLLDNRLELGGTIGAWYGPSSDDYYRGENDWFTSYGIDIKYRLWKSLYINAAYDSFFNDPAVSNNFLSDRWQVGLLLRYPFASSKVNNAPQKASRSFLDLWKPVKREKRILYAKRLATAAITIGFDPTSYTVDEDAGTATATVTLRVLTGALSEPLEVGVQTQDGTALNGFDYTSVNETVTLDASTSSATVDIPLLGDDIAEGTEAFTATLSLSTLVTSVSLDAAKDTATVNIDDHGDAITIGFDPTLYTVNEDAGMATVTLRVLTGTLSDPLEVGVQTQDGTASGSDYTSVNQTVTFDASTSSATVDIPLLDDAIPEGAEAFTVRLSLPTLVPGVSLDAAKDIATVNINDGDATIGFDRTSYRVNENAGMATVTLGVLSGALSDPLDVRVQTQDGTALNGSDYTSVNQTVTLSASISSVTVNIPLLDDGARELDEAFTVRISLPTDLSFVTLNPASGTVNIIDNDPNTVIGFRPVHYDVDEGQQTNLIVEVKRGGALSSPVTLDFTIANGSATNDDYSIVGNTITLDPDASQNSLCGSLICQVIQLSTSADNLIENTENLSVTLSNSSGLINLEMDTATVNILSEAIEVGFTSTSYTVNEEDGSVELQIELTQGTLPEAVTLTYQVTDGTAVNNDDFIAATGTVRFPAGSVVGDSLPLTVMIVDDDIFEPTETFNASLTADNQFVVVSPDTATIDIVDRDVTIGFDPMSYTVNENAGMVTVTLGVVTGALSGPLDVRVQTQDDTALNGSDYTSVDQTVTLSASTSSATVDILLIGDATPEGTEAFTVRLSLPTPVTGVSLDATQKTATVNIYDLGDGSVTTTETDTDESDGITIGFDSMSYTVAENTIFTGSTPVLSGDAPIGTLTYTLGGDDKTAFTINTATGVISMIGRDFEAPVDANTDNVYEVEITVTDSDNNTDSEAQTVTVTDVIETINFTIDAIADASVAENTAFTGSTPSLSGDTPIGSVTYTLGGTDAADFTINNTSGVIAMVARDFEAPDDANTDNAYEVSIIATDTGGNTDTETQTVTVTDVTETINFAIDAIADASVAENAVFTGSTPSLSGDTPIGSVTYTLGGTDAADFTINNTSGVIAMVARDFEAPDDANTDNAYEVSIIATDTGGNTDTETQTVTVTDVTEAINFTIDAIADASVAENTAFTGSTPSLSGDTPIGTLTYSLAGTDADDFTINTTNGVISMIGRDFEAPVDANTDNVYEVEITVTDSDNNTDSEAQTVTVTDVTETINFAIDPIADTSVAENAVFTGSTPSLSGDTPIGSVTYTLGGTDAADFTINNTSGVIAMVARDFEAPDDANTDNAYEVSIIATDTDGNTDTETQTVTVTDVTETINFTIDPIADTSVAENAVFTGSTPSLSGDAPIGSVTYTLGGTDAADFTINNTSGVIAMVARDFEAPDDANTNNVYEVSIIATDSDNNTASEAQTVTVTNVLENTLSISAQTRSIAENAANGTTLGAALTTTGSPTGFSITAGNIGNAFAISNTGQITVATSAAVNFDITPFSLSVQITKADAAPKTATVTVNIVATVTQGPIVLGFDPVSVNRTESTAIALIRVRLRSGELKSPVTLDYTTVDGSAVAGEDYYMAENGQVTVLVEDTCTASTNDRSPICAIIGIPLIDDDVREPTEAFTVRISLPTDSPDSSFVTLNPASGTVNITDNDLNTVIGFRSVDYDVDEGQQTNLIVEVKSGGALSSPVTLDFNIANGSTTDADYSIVENTITLDPDPIENLLCGDSSICQMIELSAIVDNIIENTENLSVTLSNTSELITLDLNTATATVNIHSEVIEVGFTSDSYTVNEEDGSVELQIELTQGTLPLPEAVTLTYEITDGTAVNNDDYSTATATGTVSFPANSMGGTRTLTVMIVDDDIFEPTETFNASLTADNDLVVVSPKAATIEIADNDVTIGFDRPSNGARESIGTRSLNVCVLDGVLTENVTLNYSTTDGDAVAPADYSGVTSQAVLLQPDSECTFIYIDIVDDALVEPDEIFTVSLSELEPADMNNVRLRQDTTEVVIRDQRPDGAEAIVVGFDSPSYSVEEGNTVKLLVRVIEGTLVAPLTFNYTLMDNTALLTSDYTSMAGATGVITLNPNAAQDIDCPSDGVCAVISVDASTDNLFEDGEDFSASLTFDPLNSTSPDTEKVTVDTSGTTVNIVDQTQIVIGFSQDNYDTTEGSLVEPRVGVIGTVVLMRSITVNYQTVDGTALASQDYTSGRGTVTLTPDAPEVSIPGIQIEDDTIVELEERFTVDLSLAPQSSSLNVDLDPDLATIAPDLATIVIADDPLDKVALSKGAIIYSSFDNLFTVRIRADDAADLGANSLDFNVTIKDSPDNVGSYSLQTSSESITISSTRPTATINVDIDITNGTVSLELKITPANELPPGVDFLSDLPVPPTSLLVYLVVCADGVSNNSSTEFRAAAEVCNVP